MSDENADGETQHNLKPPSEVHTQEHCCAFGTITHAKESPWGWCCFACASPHCLADCFVKERCFDSEDACSQSYCKGTCKTYARRNIVCCCYPCWCCCGCLLCCWDGCMATDCCCLELLSDVMEDS
mmetsp:Transcript_16713/g.50008  ORF Transcript_16713/g.50008 Transcript_16713/m.50008 type:complete len:126 (+) Transcript_16713:156-533(+)